MTKETELKFPFKFYHKDSPELIYTALDTGYKVEVVWNEGRSGVNYSKCTTIDLIAEGTWVIVENSENAKQKLEQLLSTRGEEVIEWITEKLKEFDKQQNIKKELDFAKAKRERLDKHISVLEGKLK